MIDIIKHGKYGAFQATCGLCGCVFKFGKDDAHYAKFLFKYYVECPECHNNFVVGSLSNFYDENKEE